jgi:hypothetical protein
VGDIVMVVMGTGWKLGFSLIFMWLARVLLQQIGENNVKVRLR